jgi:hypothetical protein
VDINGAIGRLPLRLKCRVLYLPRRDDGEDGSAKERGGDVCPSTAKVRSCSFPGGTTGKVAPPRNEAETDGAGSHQLGLRPKL